MKEYLPSHEQAPQNTFHIEVIADYGGSHTTDHAFNEVVNHFRRYDTKQKQITEITQHPVSAFSTIETGFWIAQMGLHNDHEGLVIFSNTAPRGDIAWNGQEEQPFVYGKLDNDVPVFAVNAGYNLSFVKDRLTDIHKIMVPNTGTQFRSRDQYPAATMQILQGDKSLLGKKIDKNTIPDVPECAVGSIDGYGNIKTTFRKSKFLANEDLAQSPLLRVRIDQRSHFALNTVMENTKGVTGDLCTVIGSSGGKRNPFIEVIRLQGKAAEDFHIDCARDDLKPITFEPVKAKEIFNPAKRK